MELKPKDQVVHRQAIRTGNLVRIGEVVQLSADGRTAQVHFPTLYKSEQLPVEQLEKTEKVFGVPGRVQASPVRRTIQSLRRA